MKWMCFTWWAVGCVFVGVSEGYWIAKCPDDPGKLVSVNSLISVAIWPAFPSGAWVAQQYGATFDTMCKGPASSTHKKQDRLDYVR